MNTKRLTLDSMLIAIYSVLSILTPIKIENFKFTLEAFPILVAGLLLGPIDGLIVGGIGSLVYQLLFSGYGLTATTLLWVLPHAISGLVVGLYANSNKHEYNHYKIIFITIVSAVIVTILNCFALYVDARLYGYYSSVLVFSNIALKLLTGIILAIIYSSVLPRLLSFLKKQI